MRALLSSGAVSINAKEHACKISGFYPIHACIANSLPNMYDLLTQELPPELRSSDVHVTRKGSRMDLKLYSLSCMQLAAQLGDHSMLRHMLRKQCQTLCVIQLPLFHRGPTDCHALARARSHAPGLAAATLTLHVLRAGADGSGAPSPPLPST